MRTDNVLLSIFFTIMLVLIGFTAFKFVSIGNNGVGYEEDKSSDNPYHDAKEINYTEKEYARKYSNTAQERYNDQIEREFKQDSKNRFKHYSTKT